MIWVLLTARLLDEETRRPQISDPAAELLSPGTICGTLVKPWMASLGGCSIRWSGLFLLLQFLESSFTVASIILTMTTRHNDDSSANLETQPVRIDDVEGLCSAAEPRQNPEPASPQSPSTASNPSYTDTTHAQISPQPVTYCEYSAMPSQNK